MHLEPAVVQCERRAIRRARVGVAVRLHDAGGLGRASTVMLSGPMQAFLIGVGGGAGVGGRGGRGAGSGPRQTQISSA